MTSKGLILLLGNDDSPMNAAKNPYTFRQDSSFLYFAGIDIPGMAMTIDLDSGEETLYGYDVTMDDIVWTGPQPSLASLAGDCGIAGTRDSSDLANDMRAAKASGRDIHFLPPYRAGNAVKLFEFFGVHPSNAISEASEELIKAIVSLRSYKSDEEIVEIEKAVDTTAEMHIAAMKCARPGMKESDVVSEIYKVTHAADVMWSFPAIVTVHGEILHNHHHHHTLEEGKLLLVDCGAEAKSHYAGDMTRAFPVAKTYTQKQRDIYETVLEAEVKAAEALKPGVAYRDIHLLASKVIAERLVDLRLMKGNVDDAVEVGAHALFFQHGLGHMMGLDVHDMEDLGENYVGYGDNYRRSAQFGLGFLRLARELEPGFVLTVEPGIYFIPQLIERWSAEGKHSEFINYDVVNDYLDFGGIRIEEDFLVTSDGARRLGKPAPKTVEEVEALRQ